MGSDEFMKFLKRGKDGADDYLKIRVEETRKNATRDETRLENRIQKLKQQHKTLILLHLLKNDGEPATETELHKIFDSNYFGLERGTLLEMITDNLIKPCHEHKYLITDKGKDWLKMGAKK